MSPFNDQYINSNAYRYVALTELENAGVQIFMGMPVVDAVQEKNGIRIEILGEFGIYEIFAERVVDTTQGAGVCALLGRRFDYPVAYMGTLPKVSGIEIHKLINYIRNTSDNWFLRPMSGKNTDPDQMERLVEKQRPLAIHGFNHALNQAVREHPEFMLLRKTLDCIMFFMSRIKRERIGLLTIICIIQMFRILSHTARLFAQPEKSNG